MIVAELAREMGLDPLIAKNWYTADFHRLVWTMRMSFANGCLEQNEAFIEILRFQC